MTIGEELDRKLDRLARRLRGLLPGLIAVSGGLDSRFLASFARDLDLSFHAVHFTGPHMAPAETRAAVLWLERLGRPWRLVEIDPLVSIPVRTNDPERCYHCKRLVFERARDVARDVAVVAPVLDGTQASDAGVYRPGRRALAELGVVSPLAEAGLAKEEIRAAARAMGLEGADQPGRPCLLTRFAYGLTADAAALARLAAAEERLAELGLREFRLRVVGGGQHILQISLAEGPVWERVEALALPALAGFRPCKILLSETVSGFHDRQE